MAEKGKDIQFFDKSPRKTPTVEEDEPTHKENHEEMHMLDKEHHNPGGNNKRDSKPILKKASLKPDDVSATPMHHLTKQEVLAIKVEPEFQEVEVEPGRRLSITKDSLHASKHIAPGRRPTVDGRTNQYYRRGSIVLARAADSHTVNNAVLQKMKELKDKGVIHNKSIAGLALFAARGDAQSDPYAVQNYPMLVQLSFRRKLYGILLFESLLSLGISLLMCFVPSIATFFNQHQFPYEIYVIWGVAIVFLLFLYCAKYSYPANYLTLFLFSIIKGVVVSISYAITNNLDFPVFLGSFSIVIFLLFVSTSTITEADTSNPKLLTIYKASFVTWVIYFILLLCILIPTNYFKTGSVGMLLVNLLLMTIVIWWFAYDSTKMMFRIAVDEYMQGVIFFYTDIFLVMVLILIMALAVAAAGDAGGAPIFCDCGYVGVAGNVPPTEEETARARQMVQERVAMIGGGADGTGGTSSPANTVAPV